MKETWRTEEFHGKAGQRREDLARGGLRGHPSSGVTGVQALGFPLLEFDMHVATIVARQEPTQYTASISLLLTGSGRKRRDSLIWVTVVERVGRRGPFRRPSIKSNETTIPAAVNSAMLQRSNRRCSLPLLWYRLPVPAAMLSLDSERRDTGAGRALLQRYGVQKMAL
jgi:hypothetical protein